MIFMKKTEPYRYRLLYIEDNPSTRALTAMFLDDYFEEIYQASNGIEGLEIYKEKKPDIIITDIEMPKMSGLEFCKNIRQDNKDIPIIIITGHINIEYLLEAVELNLIKYLGKPLQEDKLLDALDRCIQQIESKSNTIFRLTKELYFDTLNQTISSKKEIINLTHAEYKFLDILVKNTNRIVSYIEIENYVWEDKYMSKDSIRSLVRKVRKIVGKGLIENISKTGYKIKLYE